jgi:hypothetical protein
MGEGCCTMVWKGADICIGTTMGVQAGMAIAGGSAPTNGEPVTGNTGMPNSMDAGGFPPGKEPGVQR